MRKNHVTGTKAAKCYIKSIRHSLSCPRDLERDMLSDLRSDIDRYLQENPNASIEDMTARFGEPAELSESYLSSLDAKELVKKVKAAKRVRRIVLLTCLIALLLLIATFYKIIQDNKSNSVSYIVETISDGPLIPVEE